MSQPKLTWVNGTPVYLWEAEPTVDPANPDGWPAGEIDMVEIKPEDPLFVNEWIDCDWVRFDPQPIDRRRHKRFWNRELNARHKANKLKG